MGRGRRGDGLSEASLNDRPALSDLNDLISHGQIGVSFEENYQIWLSHSPL